MPKLSKKILFFFLVLLVGLLVGNFVLADLVFAQDLGINYVAPLNLSNADPREAAVGVTALLMTFLGIIATIVVIYGGFIWVTSAGDPQKIDKAKKVIIGGVIGLVLILSAFIIVSFILNNIGDALEPGQTCEPACVAGESCCTKGGFDDCCTAGQFCCGSGIGCSDIPCGSIGETDDSFIITKTIPPDGATDIIRNVAVRVSFNKPVDGSVNQTILNNNFIIEKIANISSSTRLETPSGPTIIAGEDVIISESRKNISFKAAAACGDEKNTPNCFPEWSKFEVTIDGSSEIVATGPQGLSGNTRFEFSTNNLIDTGPPTAGIVPTQMCVDDGTLAPDANLVGGWGRDDIGIAEIRFDADSVLNWIEPGTFNKYQYTEYQYDTSAMTIGSIHDFSLEADDMVGNMASDNFNATLRIGHCCNGIIDPGEEEIDCGGPDCDPCVTKDPVIYWFSPDNGAPGNWITIGGRNFGDTPGSVFFWDDSDGDFTRLAAFPDTVNPACTSNWQDDQIIVIVPSGAADIGPVRVVRADGKEDTTDNTNGPVFDFYVNAITRPGICLAAPDNGFFDDALNIQGTAFSGAARSVNFGSETSNITANNINFLSALSVNSTVPNIKKGKTSVFVEVTGESSNYLKYSVLYDASSKPIIDYIDPASGPVEQYITIYGSNFKSRTGASRVEFLYPASGATVDADGFDFPPECQGKWWRDNYIVVKVPDVAVLDAFYEVRVTNRDNQTSDPEDFEVEPGPPGPGLCLLDPYNGPVNTQVYAYGDKFGNTQGSGLVRFYNNTTSTIIDWANQLIDTSVPGGAETGSVRVSNGSQLSNPLPFTVGSCDDDSQCDVTGGDVCCGGGTYWSGICRQASDCSISPAGISGYGWSFSTASSSIECADDQEACGTVCCSEVNGCDENETDKCAACEVGQDECGDLSCCNADCEVDIFGSYCPTCAGYNTNQCSLNNFCPNSAGQCSPSVGGQEEIGDCDSSCNSITGCAGDACTYESGLDQCTQNGPGCDLATTTLFTDAVGSPVKAYCDLYSANGRWHINTSLSCPSTDWVRVPGNTCINTIINCSLCDSGFECLELDGDGVCAVDKDICPSNATCDLSDKCVRDEAEACECCCEIGQDARDCCAPLTCEGSCGNDTDPFDAIGYGECSGCANTPDPDAACNCAGTSGKYCDTSDSSYPEGVCRDCSRLSDSEECSQHSGVCCVDDMFGDKCRSGVGDTSIISGDDPNLAYCSYYSCAGTDPDSCNPNASTTGTFRNELTCEKKCDDETLPKPGARCVATTTLDSLICDPTFDCGSVDYACIDTDPSDCGRCCCDPTDPPQVNKYDLVCYEDKSPCDGGNRGLYCGCVSDIECGNTDSTACGSDPDKCCYPRPGVDSVEPPDEFPDPGSGNGIVCRNAMITADFNGLMDLSSFSSNVIVVGDYGQEFCPEGTTYLALGEKNSQKRNIFAIAYINFKNTIYQILSDVLPSRYAQAYTPPNTPTNRNYCAITGSVSGFHDPEDFSTLKFSPSRLLDPDRLYYAIIKGDKELTDDKNDGVLGQWKISMNGSYNNVSPSCNSGVCNNIFNGINYENSYIWSFRTLSDQTQNKGVCLIDHVDMKPSSYLFKTTKDAINSENDGDQYADSFDTVYDSDKVFAAKAMSKDNQELAPIPGYSWDWSWTVDNPVIADFDVAAPFVSTGTKRLVEAQPTATEGSTYVNAAIDMTGHTNPISTAADGTTGVAEIYLFICENPWPPIKTDGTWRPWRDDTEGMSGGCIDGPCINTNYEIYYCRDDGQVGTIDDLPAILSEDTIIRGNTGYIFKEAYFFREDRPAGASGLTATSTPTAISGGSVDLTWAPVPGADGYKIYWGVVSGDYNDYEDVGNVSVFPYTLTGFNNGTTYYFNLTSYFSTGAESGFYGETELLVEDISLPAAITLATTTPGDGEVMLEWDANIDDTESYEINYGVNPGGPYGFSEDIGSDTAVIISGLTNGRTYYFAVRAVDGSGSKSGYSNETSAIPFARPTNLTARTASSSEIDLSCNLNGSGVSQAVEWGTESGVYTNSDSLGGIETTYTVTSLSSSTKYYFIVTSDNGSLTASSSEVSATTYP